MKDFFKHNLVGIVALLVAAGFGLRTLKVDGAGKMAFVDSQRLMTGFKEANQADKELRDEDAKWRGNLKVLEDSIKAFMDTMSVKFDKSDLKTKKSLQDELSLRNQQANNFERANVHRMQEMNKEKIAKIYQKINSFMKEYGKSKGYQIIFGTANGSILYGEGTPSDITDDVIKNLNQRYE